MSARARRLAIGAARAASGAARVVGVDFSGSMLTHGLEKVRGAVSASASSWCAAMPCACPSPTHRSTRVTIAFGIRNVQRPESPARSCCGCCRPGGRLAILEFGTADVAGLRARSITGIRATSCPASAASCRATTAPTPICPIHRGLSLRRGVRGNPACRRIFTGRRPGH